MNTGSSPQDDADLEEFLKRTSSLSADYDQLELVEPSDSLDAKVLAAAKAAARPVVKAAPASATAEAPKATPMKGASAHRPPPVAVDDDDDEIEDAPATQRPRWMLPAALAASVLAAVGIGFAVLDISPSDDPGTLAGQETSGLGSMFAKRARARSEAEKAAAEAAAAEAEVMVMESPPPPPPPFFELDGPQVNDLDAAITLIRRELILARERDLQDESLSVATLADSAAGSAADTMAATAEPPAAPASASPESSTGSTSVIQSRNRRLAKVLELYDTGNPYLAGDALEIFLRDFADDPISQRILEVKP